MPDSKYQSRDVLDKLGIKPGQAVAFERLEQLSDLRQRVVERTGRPPAAEDERVDIALVAVDETSDPVAVLKKWRARLVASGGIWLLTAKRGQAGYVDQRELIAAGQSAGVVDNKVCAVSATVSAMRFVIRKAERAD